MTYKEAQKIIGNRAKWEVKAIVKALSLHSWLNTPEETKRLQAGKIILRGGK